MSITEKLKELGIELPGFNPPAANYSPAIRTGDFIFTEAGRQACSDRQGRCGGK